MFLIFCNLGQPTLQNFTLWYGMVVLWLCWHRRILIKNITQKQKACEKLHHNYTDILQCQLHFYTPVWKTGRIMPWQCPSVRLSVRLSVRPSVRPRFPDFSSTCFEISIWNLVYTFSRWHDMSSLSRITIGSLWPSLQPKVGQTYFLQSWPHKSR